MVSPGISRDSTVGGNTEFFYPHKLVITLPDKNYKGQGEEMGRSQKGMGIEYEYILL